MKSLVATPLRKCLIMTTSLAVGALAMASSHSDAPLIKQDPQVNLTDVYGLLIVKKKNRKGTGRSTRFWRPQGRNPVDRPVPFLLFFLTINNPTHLRTA